MGLRHDLMALAAGARRPDYGRALYFAGRDLPAPSRVLVPTRHGEVRCLRYAGSARGRYVHLHGGAFVMRHPSMDDFWARFVCATTGVEVWLPDYSVAPRVRYPVAHEQVYDVTAFLAGGGPRVAESPLRDGPVVVGGFSAGGNLAAATALWARDAGVALAGQLLAVPSVDIAEDVGAKCARVPDGMLTPTLLRMVRGSYFRDAKRRSEPGASPLAAALGGLAPALVVTAEHDVLRPEGDAYAARLLDAGVPTEHVVAPGVDHYFLHGAGDTRARELMVRMARWIADRVE